MYCDEFDARFNELLDARRQPLTDAELVAHAQVCSACDAQLQGWSSVSHAMQATAPLGADDWGVRLARQHVQLHQQQQRSWRRLAWGMATSAALATAWLGLVTSGVFRAPQPLATNTADEPQVITTESSPSHASLPRNTAPATVASRASRKGDEMLRYQQAWQTIALQINETADLADMNEKLQPGLRPIQTSFGLTLKTLRRTLPRGRENRPGSTDGAFHLRDDSVTG